MFWFRPPISKANGYIEYEKTLHPIAGCDSAEEFFAVYRHLKRPSGSAAGIGLSPFQERCSTDMGGRREQEGRQVDCAS